MKLASIVLAVALLVVPPPVTTVGRGADGRVVVPTGQVLAPAGRRIEFDGRPYSVAAAPGGKLLAIGNIDSLDLVDVATGARASFAYPGARLKAGTTEAPEGLVFTSNGAMLYVSTTHYDVQRFDLRTRRWRRPIVLGIEPPKVPHHDRPPGPLPMGLALSPHNRTLDVAVDGENEVVAVDTATDRIVARASTGVAPVTVVRRGNTLAVLDWGGPQPPPGAPYGVSKYTKQHVLIDPQTGIAKEGAVDLFDARTLRLRREVIVKRHPIAARFIDADTLVVADANDDAISVVDVRSGAVHNQTLAVPGERGFGLEPQALAYNATTRRLYVALAGINAVGVYDARNPKALRLIGALPTDWYPGGLALERDGLAVTNIKGVGSLGSASNDPPGRDDVPICTGDFGATPHLGSLKLPARPLGNYDTHAYRGTLDLISTRRLGGANAATTARTVALANAFAQRDPGVLPIVHHVLYIIKENKTYDQVLGDVREGNGDPALVSFGRKVTPNIHALVHDYVLLDNFYTVGVQSGDGHQWTDEAATTDYVEREAPAWARSNPNRGTDPLAYAASGFIWQNALAHGLSVRDYGEFAPTTFQPAHATWLDFWHHRARFTVMTNIPDLRTVLDPNFPGFTRRVPDQTRADMFLHELAGFERAGTMPNLMIMSLPNDHTEGFNPKFPTPCAMAADNDYALGRIVAGLSRSRFWAHTLVLVTEDDAQDGYDHVDGHRTEGLMIGPMVRRRAVVSKLYTQLSMVRTAEAVLGLPPMNRFDASAPVMTAALTTRLNLQPYTAIPPNLPLDQMNAPITKLSGIVRALAIDAARWDVNQPDRQPAAEMRASIWLATHPQPIRPSGQGVQPR